MLTIEERLASKLEINPNGCWEWCGYLNSRLYGNIGWKGETWLTHRLAYTLWVGEIPDGVLICHKCDNPRCCNPEHLFPGTQSDNMHDRWDKFYARLARRFR